MTRGRKRELAMPSAYDDYFRPIVNKWVEMVRAAETAKKPFQDVADQLMAFYAAKNGFMFEKEYREKYLGLTNENQLPRHRLNFNKSFEFVALFAPMLFWDNPQRVVKPRKKLQITPDQFGITPQMQQQWQQYQQQMGQYQQAAQQYQQMMQTGAPPPPSQPGQPPQPWPPPPPQPPPPVDPMLAQSMSIWDWSQQQTQQRATADNIRCQLLEGWLNYTPGEIPHGGLAAHSRLAIVEALVKGRGCLWSAPYQFAGSEKVLIGSFYDTVDNFLMDPDATGLFEAKWIMQRVVAPVYAVEAEFKLTPGSLDGKGGSVVAQQKMPAIGGAGTTGEQRKDKIGRTSELITYYKVWSKCGVGTKVLGPGADPDMKANIERVSGDYAFLCICPNVDYPLNLPADQLEGMSDDEVRERLEWPFPTWKDDRWPVACLDFYPHPNRAWPVAPLAPALGELIFLQVIMSHLADRVVKSSRDFIAVAQSAAEEIEEAIKNGGDLTVLKLTEVHNNINEVVQFLQQPATKQDYWKIVEFVVDLFERRTGLTELAAGQTSTQSRSAQDARIKGDQLQVRPEDMQRKVEAWQTEVCKLEAIATRWFIEPQDVEMLFGPVGSYLWQMYVTSANPEQVIRETDCTIEAGSVRKPNKSRDVENFNALAQLIAPVVSGHYQQTGDPGPLMFLLTKWADVFDGDIAGLQFQPPPPPQPDPNMQAEQQSEMQSRQMDMAQQQQKMQFDAAQAQTKNQFDGQKMQLELAKLQGELQVGQMKAEAERAKAQAALQQVIVEQQLGQQEAQTAAQEQQVKLAATAAELQIGQKKAEQDLTLQSQKANQELMIADLKSQQEMQHQAQMQQVKKQQALFDPVARLFGSGNEK